jgi:CRP-like cAMP-binding protein
MASRAESIHGRASVSLKETLVKAGLAPELATLLENMPHRTVQVDPRRPFREPGVARNEVMFVKSGIVSKYKPDGSGRRQIVALRFPGEGILPREGAAGYGVQAIVRSEIMVGKAEDFDSIVDKNPEMARFFWRLIQRNEAIGYEWLVNCGRRDSIARVAHLLCETATSSCLVVDHESMTYPLMQQQIADFSGQT